MTSTETTTLWLDLSAIEPNPFNPRKHFSETELAELAASIQEQGLLQPILVRPLEATGRRSTAPKPGITHQIVLGERRWRALQRLGWPGVEVNVRAMTDLESLQAALAENIQREDLTDYEEAAGLQAVVEQAEKAGQKVGISALVKMFGKSETYIRNRLGLFNLKPDVQDLTRRHRQVLSSAYKINKVADPETRQELIELVDEGASYKTIEARIEQHEADRQWQRDSQTPPDPPTRNALKTQSARISEAEKQIQTALDEAERHLINAATWLPHIPAHRHTTNFATQLARLKKRLEEME